MPTETYHSTFNSTMVDETACESCKVPEVYGKFFPCTRGGADIYERWPKNNDELIALGFDTPAKRKAVKGKVKLDSAGNPIKSEDFKNKGGHKFKKTGNKVPKFYASATFKNNPVKRMIGYEVEVSGCTDGAAVSSYVRSIGGGICQDCFFEINTPPSNGDELIKRTKELSETIRKCGAIAKSNAGLHTHVDCRDLSYNDIRKVCLLYGKVEGALYSIIDPKRTSNTNGTSWCKPYGPGLVTMMSNPLTAKKDVCRLVMGSEEAFKVMKSFGKGFAGDRYLGLNLQSWWTRGTIEFRMHHGTTKWQKMLPWGMLLGSLVETATLRGDDEIAKWPTGKAGLLALCPPANKEIDVAKWVNERWDYFASKRKNPNQPLF